MRVSVEVLNKLERRLSVSVPKEELDHVYQSKLQHLAKTAQIKGFRPGKIPMDYVKQHFGKTAQQEAFSDLIQTSFDAAIRQEKLHVVGRPSITPKTLVLGQPLEFEATFEVMPELDAVKFSLDKIEKEIATIEEEDIDSVLNRLREQQTEWLPVTRPAQEKDKIVLHFDGTLEGKPLPGGKAENFNLILGSHSMIPGFEEGLIGLRAGEEKTLSLSFPETYHHKDIAGKPVEFKVKIISVSESKLPELTEDMIKKLGISTGSIDDLKHEIRTNLERNCQQLIRTKFKKQVFDRFSEQNPLDVPNALVEQETQRLHDEYYAHQPHHEHHHSDEEMATFASQATRNIQLAILISSAIKQYHLSLDHERVDARIHELVSMYEQPEEVKQWYKTNKRARAEMDMQILEEQLIEKLLENVAVIEKKIQYNELLKS